MSNYYPQTSYERETILNIASDQEVYLKERYGDNPLADNVPEYFKRMYNTAKHNEALDLDVWASNAMLYVGANPTALKQELRKVSHKATKKLRKFIKTHSE